MSKNYYMGNPEINIWRRGRARQLTFVVTQDCNLRCKYCYMVGKNDKHRMSFDTAKDIIDFFFFGTDEVIDAEFVVLDFIGGESLLEIKLIDKTIDYFRLKAYEKKSRWFDRFRIMIQSNGILVGTSSFKKFMKKNKGIVSLGITIDGTKRKHDLQRVFPDGSGSYDIVEKNYVYAFSQGWTNSTKVTFGHEDLPYVCESIIHLWNLGIKNVPANVVYEDVWKEGDSEIFENQLIELADYVIDHKLWNVVNTTLFMDSLGYKAPEDSLDHPVCGTGSMFCVDNNGDIYNCVRFLEYSLNGKSGISYGNIYTGIDEDKKRALKLILPKYVNPQKCNDCHVSMGCSFCSGNNYDESSIGTLYHRSTAICEMHKARVRGNNYYWARLENEYGIRRDSELCPEYYMYIIMDHNSVSYCNYSISEGNKYIDVCDLIKWLEYSYQNSYIPVFVHSNQSIERMKMLLNDSEYGDELQHQLKRISCRNIMLFKKEYSSISNTIFVINSESDDLEECVDNVILEIEADKIGNMTDKVKAVLPYAERVSVQVKNLNKEFDMKEYEHQLLMTADVILEYFKKDVIKEVRQLTDAIFVNKMNNCFAGEKNLTIGPDGNRYLCPAFYYKDIYRNLYDDVVSLSAISASPLCSECNVFQCDRCIYANYMYTGELSIPPGFQCEKGRLERDVSQKLRNRMIEAGIINRECCNELNDRSIDPFEKYDYDISHPLWDGAK